MGDEHLVGFDNLADLDELRLTEVELEKEVLHRVVGEAEAAVTLLLVEEFDENISRLVLHNQQLAVVNPKEKS